MVLVVWCENIQISTYCWGLYAAASVVTVGTKLGCGGIRLIDAQTRDTTPCELIAYVKCCGFVFVLCHSRSQLSLSAHALCAQLCSYFLVATYLNYILTLQLFSILNWRLKALLNSE